MLYGLRLDLDEIKFDPPISVSARQGEHGPLEAGWREPEDLLISRRRCLFVCFTRLGIELPLPRAHYGPDELSCNVKCTGGTLQAWELLVSKSASLIGLNNDCRCPLRTRDRDEWRGRPRPLKSE